MTRPDDRPLMMVRRGSMLCSYGPMDSNAVSSLPAGKPMRVRVSQPRNVKRLRLWWALIGLIAENLDGVTDEAMHDAMKVRLGFFDVVNFKSGPQKVPRSIAFDAMEEGEFRTLLDALTKAVREEVIPGLNSAAFERAALTMMGEPA